MSKTAKMTKKAKLNKLAKRPNGQKTTMAKTSEWPESQTDRISKNS